MDFVQQLIDARTRGIVTPRPSQSVENFDLEAGYRAGANVDAALCEIGWQHVGRKIGFTNVATWAEFGLSSPIWAYMYDRTVVDAGSRITEVPVGSLVSPRIEPEIVLGLNDRITGIAADPDTIASAIEWVAPGFEIVDCHYADWQFTAADIVADFGAHARLIVGEKTMLAAQDRRALRQALADVTVKLCRDDEVVTTGVGRNALGSPLSALASLCDMLVTQAWANPLVSGEVITTGTLTDYPRVNAGQRWTAMFAGAGLSHLTIDLI